MKLKHFTNYRLPVKHDRDVEIAGLKSEHPLQPTLAQSHVLDAVVARGFFPEPAALTDAVALRTNDVPWLTAELYNRLQAHGQTLPLPLVTTYVRESAFFNHRCQKYREHLVANLLRAGYEPSIVKSTLAISQVNPALVDQVAAHLHLPLLKDATTADRDQTADREL